MIQQPTSTAFYQAQILNALQQTGIRQTGPGGKARAFCDIAGDQLGQMESRAYLNLAQTLLPYASGDNLDFLGAIYGVARISRQDVVSTPGEQNFKFYLRRGTFGAVNGGRDLQVPDGTRIYTDSPDGPIYAVSGNVTLPASASVQYFPALALTAGQAGNAAAGVFSRHDFTNYTDSRYGSLLVANDYGLVGGRDEEDDDSYRYRINLRLNSRGGAGEADLRFAILLVPGVQDLVFQRLAGTFYVYVYGISPLVPPSLLQLVQAQVDQHSAYPLVGTAITPDLIGVSLATPVKLAPSVGSGEQGGVLAAAAQAAESYINNLGVGRSLILNELADQILQADQRIVDVGQPNRPLQEVFLWRSRADNSRYSRYLVGNYAPQVGERIVVENTPNAIALSVAT